MAIAPVQLSDAPVEMVLARLKGVRTSLRGWVACCPAHSDREPSLSIGLGDEGQVLLNCFAGCSLDRIVEAMGITLAQLFPKAPTVSDSQPEQMQRNVLTLVDLASDKLLHWKYLIHLGITEKRAGCLQIPYHLPDGTPAPRHRLRTTLVAKEGSHWSKGSGEIVPYGLERLEDARKAGYLILVEGESDCWTLWFHHFPALGLPGVEMVHTLKEAYLTGIDKLYIVREPDAAGARFVTHLQQLLHVWKWPGKVYVVSLGDAKDPNELHKKNWKGFKATFQQALDGAQPLVRAHTQPAPSSYEYTPAPFTLQELLARQLPPVQWAIPDILPEGLTLLAGKPKLGKSWLALAVALAVAAGGVALGTYPVTQGEVLYLALEDNERRLQARAQQLLASMSSVPNSIEFELRWPRLDQGGLVYLEEYLQAHPQVRLVVVDTWARVSPKAQHRQRSQYEDEYAALTPLKYLADTYRVSILAIHHLRKMRGDDVLDEITGSIGLTGAVDGALILKRERGQHEASLFVTGRDIEHEQQLALRFDAQTALWMLVGNAEEVRRTKERQDILDLLSKQFPEGMSPRQVAEALDKNYHTTRCLLRKLEAAGEIQHADSQYVAIPVDNSRNQSDYSHQCHQRNQSVPSALQRDDQVARGEEPCLPASDYVDDADYAGESVSANGSQTLSIPPPFGGCSLQFPSASDDVLSLREDIQDAQVHRDVAVINRHQRNQSMSATRQAGDHIEQSSPTGSDYVDYAHESVSTTISNVAGPPPPTGTSLQHPSAPADLLSQREDIQDTQDLRNDAVINVINRNQVMLAATQAGDHIEQPSPKWTDYVDCGDYADYANESVSAYWSQTHEPDPPLSGGSLQLSAVSEDLLVQSEDTQGTQDHRDDAVISVINRNQRNQSMSATTQVSDHVEQSSPNWTDYADYSDDIDYVDYADYANEGVSAYWCQTHEPDPPPTGSSLQHLSEAGDLLTEQEDIQGAQDQRVDYADGVINRNQRNQSMSVTTQASDHVWQSSPKCTDYSDDFDYTDYANESVSAYWSQTYEPDPPPTGASLQYLLEAGDLLTEREDIQGTQDHRVDYADGVINRHQRNQSDLPCLQATLRVEHNEGEMAVDLNDSSPRKARASPFVQSKKRCPHHPHARWIRFDPSGQAWCDRMDCWDCYRLMKIGEALDYRPLSEYTRGIVTLEQGREAWSSFVTSQGSFAVLTATQFAIDFCKALGVEVPDLSDEVQRLISAWE